ncbi:MAG: hypothetical protein M1822_007091, partial [Bathelium mastoideum]
GGESGNALQAASWGGNPQIVELLIKEGADVNAQGGEYGNALQAASWGGNPQIVELLIKEGADVNAQGGQYGNALQAASWRGNLQIVELLIKEGADVNAQGGQYGNALQAASREGNPQIVELLIKEGADVNAQGGQYGNTLQAALHKHHSGVAKMLRKAGAIDVARHAGSVDTNAGDADMTSVNGEEPHNSASPESALATNFVGRVAKILFPLETQGAQGSHASQRLTLLWGGLFFIATCGLVLWLMKGRRMASLFIGIRRNHY